MVFVFSVDMHRIHIDKAIPALSHQVKVKPIKRIHFAASPNKRVLFDNMIWFTVKAVEAYHPCH